MASASVVWEDILGDLLTFGELAVNLFVKNPAHAAQAQRIVQAVNSAVPIIQQQIAPATAVGPAPTQNTTTN